MEKGTYRNDCQEMTIGERGLKEMPPQNHNQKGQRATWGSLVGVGRGKTGECGGELDGGVRVGADGRQSEALVVESGVGREERVKMVIHGEKGFFLL